MTVDLLAATFWPEAALLGSHPGCSEPAAPEPVGIGEDAETAARDEGFWSAMLRRLRPSPDVRATPASLSG